MWTNIAIMYVVGCAVAYPIMTSKIVVTEINKDYGNIIDGKFLATVSCITSWLIPAIVFVGCIIWLFQTVKWELEYRMFRIRIRKQELMYDIMECMEDQLDEIEEKGYLDAPKVTLNCQLSVVDGDVECECKPVEVTTI